MSAAKSSAADDLDDEAAFEAELDSGQTIKNQVDLRQKAKQTKSKPSDKDPVAEAEAKMAELSDKFDDWMSNQIETLLDCWTAATEIDYAGDTRDALFRTAHDIRGQAATLGYPHAGRAAASLCKLLSSDLAADKLPRILIDQHVQAIRAMVSEGAREEHKVAMALADKLTVVTDDYITEAA